MKHKLTSTPCPSSSLLPSSFIIFCLSSCNHQMKTLCWKYLCLIVPCVLLYRWVRLSRAVLFHHTTDPPKEKDLDSWLPRHECGTLWHSNELRSTLPAPAALDKHWTWTTKQNNVQNVASKLVSHLIRFWVSACQLLEVTGWRTIIWFFWVKTCADLLMLVPLLPLCTLYALRSQHTTTIQYCQRRPN